MRTTVLVSATRLSEADFWGYSLLGRSLRQMPIELRPELRITFRNQGENAQGLPAIYNQAIEECALSRHLLFVHDDVYLHDVFLQWRIADGLRVADVLGLAGSRTKGGLQPSWGLEFDAELRCTGWQKAPGTVLSGAVSHTPEVLVRSAKAPAIELSQYGNLPAECDLLDGLFLACNTERLRVERVRFDEQFTFHSYDLDFCRSAQRAGLRLSTWPILVSHGSAGAFDSPEWKDAARRYLDKWRALDALDARPAESPTGT